MAAVAAVAFAGALAVQPAESGVRLATLVLYGLSTIALYAGSAAYHIITWPPRARYWLRVVDHGNISVQIAATATAIGWNVLAGQERLAVVTVVWLLAPVAILSSARRTPASRWLRVGLYIVMGLVGAIALPGLIAALPPAALLALVGGGVLYAVGAVVYACRYPDPFPRVFGYHEIFHLFVIAGGVAFASVVWFWVVPAVRG
ncbi:MAG: hemolysin III family protein [Chloroflexi bacterium]|nr:hemolysin III family protein [Chloroflexota bacterium]